MRDLGRIDVQERDQARHPIARNKGKEPIVLDDIDTPEVDELSLGSSPTSPQKKVVGTSRPKDTRIALHSTTPTMAHSAGQEEK